MSTEPAAAHLENGRDEVISELLSVIPSQIEGLAPFESRIERILELNLPISEIHVPQLRHLMKLGNTIGGAAVKRLVGLKGTEVKDELLYGFVEACSDYNYCVNGLADAIRPFAVPEDVDKVIALAKTISDDVDEDSDDTETHGFTSGVAEFLADIDIAIIKQKFFTDTQSGPLPEVNTRVLCNILWEHNSTQALELAGDLLLRGVDKAATAMYFIASHGDNEDGLSWSAFTIEHLEQLISIVCRPEGEAWAVRALKLLCAARSDLSLVVEARALGKTGIEKGCLLYCTAVGGDAPVFEALQRLVTDREQCAREPIWLLDQIKINWAGNEQLFVQLLKLREPRLSLALINQIYSEIDVPPGPFSIGPIEWWLEWLAGKIDPDFRFMLEERFSWFFSTCLSKEAQLAFVIEFNRPGTQYRPLLSRSILHSKQDLTTDEFSEEAISFLLTELSTSSAYGSWNGHILGKTATEQFVSDRLMPLVLTANVPLRGNLEVVLRQAGKRHGVRYLLE